MQSELLVLPSQPTFEPISRHHFSVAPNVQCVGADPELSHFCCSCRFLSEPAFGHRTTRILRPVCIATGHSKNRHAGQLRIGANTGERKTRPRLTASAPATTTACPKRSLPSEEPDVSSMVEARRRRAHVRLGRSRPARPARRVRASHSQRTCMSS